MKKLIRRALIMMVLLIPVKVVASGTMIISPNNLSLEVGENKEIIITSSNAIGDVSIEVSDTAIVTVNKTEWETGMVEEDTIKTGTIIVTGLKEGTTTIKFTIDAASFDNEDLSGEKTISVTVTKKEDNPIDNNDDNNNNNNNNNNNTDGNDNDTNNPVDNKDDKEKENIDNPKTGIMNYLLLAVALTSIAIIALKYNGKFNVFKKIK